MGNLAALPERASGYHRLAARCGVAVSDCVCRESRSSPTFAGEYRWARIAVMLSGTFHVRSRQGEALLGAGAMLLGNASDPYEFRHVDDGGDRSVVFEYEDRLLEEAGAPRFERPCIPASARSAPAVALAREALRSGDSDVMEEAGLAVLEAAVAADRKGSGPWTGDPRAHERRVARTVRHIEAHHGDDCSLAVLAALAGLSAYHFHRVFRALTGQTPRQVVIATRLRAAAAALRATREPVVRVALTAGFKDLSHFNASFVRAFGVAPRAYRRRARYSSG